MEIFILNLYFVISPQIHNLPKKCFNHHPQVFPGKPPYLNMTTVMTLPVNTKWIFCWYLTWYNYNVNVDGEDNVDNVQAHITSHHPIPSRGEQWQCWQSSGAHGWILAPAWREQLGHIQVCDKMVTIKNWLKIDSKCTFKRLQVSSGTYRWHHNQAQEVTSQNDSRLIPNVSLRYRWHHNQAQQWDPK